MRLTRESEYALGALLRLAQRPGPVVLERLAEETGAPKAFLAKAFQKLARYSILHGSPGGARGYALARSPAEISVREVLEAIEGPDLFERCLFWGNKCSGRDPCPLHRYYAPIMGRVVKMAEDTKLSDLADADSRRGHPS